MQEEDPSEDLLVPALWEYLHWLKINHLLYYGGVLYSWLLPQLSTVTSDWYPLLLFMESNCGLGEVWGPLIAVLVGEKQKTWGNTWEFTCSNCALSTKRNAKMVQMNSYQVYSLIPSPSDNKLHD